MVAIKPSGPQSIKYLLPGPLQKKFADHCFVALAINKFKTKGEKGQLKVWL